MKKYCGGCRKRKEDTEFHRWTRGDGRQPWCKDCRREYDAAYHQRVKARRLAQARRRADEFREFCASLKADRPCSDCGRTFHPAAMQWDHLPGFEKTANVGDLSRKGCRSKVLEEIAKCELVCANCHAVRTVRRRGA